MVKTCNRLGVPLAIQKLEGPSIIMFLGILLDTDKLEVRLPTEKTANLQLMLDTWAQKRACKKRELLSLIGTLSHACKVLPPGRTILYRMIDLSRQAKKMNHWLRLNKEFHSDLTWWRTFLPTWNGTNMIQPLNFQAPPGSYLHRCSWFMGVQRMLVREVVSQPVDHHMAIPEHCNKGTVANHSSVRVLGSRMVEAISSIPLRQPVSGVHSKKPHQQGP